MAVTVTLLVLALLAVVLYETDTLLPGALADDKQSEFISTAIMEFVSLAGVFLALRLFRFRKIHEELVTRKAPALQKWGLLRLAILEVPMLCNTFLYYSYMNTTFGYMAIIQALCLPFVWPTMGRCIDETEA